ncbi:flagellar biosynthesis protein FlhB [Selenomonas sp. oral taxon 136]|uniref:flagellar biosynthesis protein FlhB n=1 Tax=Selenomonas sp. oral taxon 136 TaxID=713030 RepID=UPI000767DF67|nr:flagellar biosynthesis protein FlhB [Selenomonas sp. oral taxon 136]AME04074.1 flagellar biosynthetic protein FlhB [Selenomonas sp. oral taxon 136]
MEIYHLRYAPSNRATFVFDLQRFAGGEKTEEPTAKKRADARKKGQVGRSQELNTAFVLLVGFFTLKLLWDSIYLSIASYTTYVFTNLNQSVDTENIIHIFIGIIVVLAKTAFPVMFAIMLIGLAINFFQVGLTFNTESIEFKLDKLNPINGFGRIFSKRSLVELAKSFFKILVIGFFLYRFIHEQILAMPQFMFFDLTTSLALVAEIIFQMAFIVIGVIMIMALMDYGYQKWQTTQDLKMTKQEVKDEMKQSEGDPQIKGKIRQKQRQMAMARMMKEVPKADVIVTNPTHYAIALSYQQGMSAPLVVAKGQDLVAQRIKEIAREARVPIIENKPLARALYAAVQIGDAIPQELYQAVAEVLAYVYRLKHARRGA